MRSLLSEIDTNILDRNGPRGWWLVRHTWVRLIEDQGNVTPVKKENKTLKGLFQEIQPNKVIVKCTLN